MNPTFDPAPNRMRLSLAGAVTPGVGRLMAVAFAATLGFFAFNSFLSPYLRSSGVTVVSVGLFYSLSCAFEAPAAFVGGVLADHLGRRPVLATGRLLRSVGWVTVVLAPTKAGLVAAAILLGVGGLAGSAYRSLIAESAAPGRRAGAFAIIGVVENAVGMAVPLVVGLAAVHLGLRPVLVTAAAISAFGVVVLTARLSETMAARRPSGPAAAEVAATGAEATAPAPPRATRPTRPSPLASLRFMVEPQGRGAALMAGIWLITGFMMALTPPIFGLYVADRFGVSYAGLGAISSTMALGAVLGMFFGGQIADHIGHSHLMVISLCVTVPSWILVTLADEPWLFAVVNIVTYLAAYIGAACWEAVGANTAPRRVRGGVIGIFGALQAVGAMLGAAVSGLAYSRSILLPWYIMAGADLSMLFLILAGRRAGLRGFAPKALGSEAD